MRGKVTQGDKETSIDFILSCWRIHHLPGTTMIKRLPKKQQKSLYISCLAGQYLFSLLCNSIDQLCCVVQFNFTYKRKCITTKWNQYRHPLMTAFASKQTSFVRRVNVWCHDNWRSRSIEHFKSSELKEFLLCTSRSGGIKRCKEEEDDQSLTPTFLFDLYKKTSAYQKLAHTELQRRHHMPGTIVKASFSYFHSLITIRSLPAGRRLNV